MRRRIDTFCPADFEIITEAIEHVQQSAEHPARPIIGAPPANTAHYVSALIPQWALVEVELDAITVDPAREDEQPGLACE